jgi:hypothetical protein
MSTTCQGVAAWLKGRIAVEKQSRKTRFEFLWKPITLPENSCDVPYSFYMNFEGVSLTRGFPACSYTYATSSCPIILSRQARYRYVCIQAANHNSMQSFLRNTQSLWQPRASLCFMQAHGSVPYLQDPALVLILIHRDPEISERVRKRKAADRNHNMFP